MNIYHLVATETLQFYVVTCLNGHSWVYDSLCGVKPKLVAARNLYLSCCLIAIAAKPIGS
jgi:hypothetical protein